jgi:hypothetical protein
MDVRPDTIAARARRAAAVSLLALLAAVFMTWPLAAGFGSMGRVNSGDGRFSIWNVAWVAHALTTDPSKTYDTNIFYPHRGTLAYSEANLGAGALAVPVWALTHNPYAAHNFVVLFSFAASIVATWLLVKRLTRDSAAGAVAALLFAFCPFLFTHTAHIQLLMCAGIPLSMLMLHRLVDAPSPGRAVALGCALAAQGLSCAYYGIFAGLMVGYATLFYAVARRLWRTPRYWIAVAIAAGISIAFVLPFFLPYVRLQHDEGFRRSLDDARMYSAILRSYLASGAAAHRWMLPLIGTWNHEALFPGFVATALGLGGLAVVTRSGPRDASGPAGDGTSSRETAVLYGSLGLLAFWASLGPRAGLYTLLFRTVPVFSLLRAPGRMGLVVALALAVFAGFAVERLRARVPARRRALTISLVVAALIDLNALPLDWRRAEAVPPGYALLAGLPRGPVAEFPFFDRRIDFHIHTRYMLLSVSHWQPLLNGYSDYIPPDFRSLATTLASFPSPEAFAALRDRRTRYIVLHRDRDGYGRATEEIERRLDPFRPHLRPIASDSQMAVFEIVSWP